MKPRKPERGNYKDITELKIPLYDRIIIGDLDKDIKNHIEWYNYTPYEIVEPFVPVKIDVTQETDYGSCYPSVKIELTAKGKMILTDASFKKIEKSYEKELKDYEEEQKRAREFIEERELKYYTKLKKKYQNK